MQKVIPIGSAGQLTISESGGVASISVSISQSVGGGSVAGVASGSLSASVQLSAAQLIDAGLELAKEKFPSAAAVINGAKAAIDAEMAKL